jgi:NitT/TauT family transport system substrate-binding protein
MEQNRRRFLAGLDSIAAAIEFYPSVAFANEGKLETTSVRINKSAALCIAPGYLAEELLRAEGFTDIQYVESPPASNENLIRHKADFMLNYASNFIVDVDGSAQITMLAGVHVGCFELFGNDKVGGITDLKSKSVGIQSLGTLPHILVSLLTAQVGLDPKKDIHLGHGSQG